MFPTPLPHQIEAKTRRGYKKKYRNTGRVHRRKILWNLANIRPIIFPWIKWKFANSKFRMEYSTSNRSRIYIFWGKGAPFNQKNVKYMDNNSIWILYAYPWAQASYYFVFFPPTHTHTSRIFHMVNLVTERANSICINVTQFDFSDCFWFKENDAEIV